MKCNVCYKDMRLDLKIKNNHGTIEKWVCRCGKENVRSIKVNKIKIR